VASKAVGKFRNGTQFRLSFPTLPNLSVQPLSIELIQKQGHHDVLVVEYASTSNYWFKRLKTGIPVQFWWQQGSRSRSWVGYISTVSKKTAGQQERPLKMYCVGASFKFKNNKPRVFKNKTISEVVALLAKEQGFKFVGENHPLRYSQMSISGESYWEWIQKAAKRIGYFAYIEGMALVFKPVDKVLDEASTDVPLMQFWGFSRPTSQYQLDRTLDSIEVLSGEYVEDGFSHRTVKQVGGVDPITNKKYFYSSSPKTTGTSMRQNTSDVLFNDQQYDRVINSRTSAQYNAVAEAHLSRFNLPAKLIGQGDPRISPFKMLYVEGTGEETDGYWLIRTAKHVFRRGGHYGIEITAATDGLGPNRVTAKRRGTYSGQNTSRTTNYLNTRGVGTLNFDQLLSNATYTTDSRGTYAQVRLNQTNYSSAETIVLENKVDVNSLIASKQTGAIQGAIRTPTNWKSKYLGTPFKKSRCQ